MLYVVAVVCPPLAVLLVEGPGRAAANAALTCFLYLPGVAHAVTAVERYGVEQRNEALLRAVTSYDAR